MNQSPEYQYGIEVENQIIDILGLIPASQEDNIYNDIDAWWPGYGNSYSIKCQHTALRTGNLAFEIQTETLHGRKNISWFYTGKAKLYLIAVGHEIFAIDRMELSEYISQYGWDRTASLSAKTQQSQRDIGHQHVNATVGLISIERLKSVGLIRHAGNLPF